MMRWA